MAWFVSFCSESLLPYVWVLITSIQISVMDNTQISEMDAVTLSSVLAACFFPHGSVLLFPWEDHAFFTLSWDYIFLVHRTHVKCSGYD
jgi:hypothetical protein